MIIRSKLTRAEINSIKLTDEITLELVNGNNETEITRVKVVVKAFIKDRERCRGCTGYADELTEYMKKKYCPDCLKLEQKRRSDAQFGHPQYKKAFGGTMHGTAFRDQNK